MLSQSQAAGTGPPQRVTGARSDAWTVAFFGIVIVVVVLAPFTVIMLVGGPIDLSGFEALTFFWVYLGSGYAIGVWMARDAQRRGMNGVKWGLLCVLPWWPLLLWAYSLASHERPFVTPPS